MLRSSGIVAVLSLVVFSSAANASHTNAQSDADTKEIAAYRLTMAGLKRVAAVTRAMAEEMRQDPKFQEIQKLEEEIEALEKKDELSDAEQARVEKLRERKEALLHPNAAAALGAPAGRQRTVTAWQLQHAERDGGRHPQDARAG